MSFRATYLGHAAFTLEIGGYQVLLDPYLDDNPAAAVKSTEVEADFILISHGHGDHVGDSVAIAKRTGAQVIANAEISRWLREQGVEAHAQHIGGAHQHAFGNVKFTLALHGSGLPDGTSGGNPVGFVITDADGRRAYFACDTGLFSDMQLIGAGGLDLAALPIGDNFTMGPDDALQAVKFLRARHVIPIHYNTFPLLEQDAAAWADRVRAETDSQPHILEPGDSFEL